MKNSKLWDGRRVRINRSYGSSDHRIKSGEVVTLKKVGVVRMRLETDDGRAVELGVGFQRDCFEPVDGKADWR